VIPSTAHIRVGADGTTRVETALRLTASSRIRCCTYPDRPAIVSPGDGHVSVSLTVPDPAQVTVDDLPRSAWLRPRPITSPVCAAR
jgi:hypothetical protein